MVNFIKYISCLRFFSGACRRIAPYVVNRTRGKECAMRTKNGSGAISVSRTRGRPFSNGNPGRKPGSKNRSTLIGAALLQDEARDLVTKGIELAKAGNVALLKFFLNRILPRDRTVTLDLPALNFADDAVAALGLIMRQVSEGTITPWEGAGLATVVQSYSRAIDTADVVKRLDLLEKEIWSARGMKNAMVGVS